MVVLNISSHLIAISQVDRDGFIYVYDNNDIDGPWKNLSYFDQSSVLLQPFRKESKIKLLSCNPRKRLQNM